MTEELQRMFQERNQGVDESFFGYSENHLETGPIDPNVPALAAPLYSTRLTRPLKIRCSPLPGKREKFTQCPADPKIHLDDDLAETGFLRGRVAEFSPLRGE